MNSMSLNNNRKFDNFAWLLNHEVVIKNIEPNENILVHNLHSEHLTELDFLISFYDRYIRVFGSDFIYDKIDTLENEAARRWAIYALKMFPSLIQYKNEEFIQKLENLLSKLKLPYTNLMEVFEPYMPFITMKDYFNFAYSNVDSPLYKYFWILLILFYEKDYPIDPSKRYPQSYHTCEERYTCKKRRSCYKHNECWFPKNVYGKDYDLAKEVLNFQKEMTLSFLAKARKGNKSVLLAKLYESLQQINKSGFFEEKLSLSYDKVLYAEGRPLNGRFYMHWDKVIFYNGYFIIKHPDVPFNKAQSLKIEDPNSRKVFNDINSLFMKKLPPLHVQAHKGRVTKVIDKANISNCISIMEHKVNFPNAARKKATADIKSEKKEVSKTEARILCKELKSSYLDYLCSKQLDAYKVICCIEHRVNSNGATSCEYSFIFTIKEAKNKIFLAYENASESRCTYLLAVTRQSWKESIEKIYNFFASNEVNKRQLMASRLVDLQLPGNYEYQRVFHSDYFAWVDKVNHPEFGVL